MTGLSNTAFLDGTRSAAGAWVRQIPNSINGTLLFFFVLFVLRVLLRRQWLAAAAFVILIAGPRLLMSNYPWVDGPMLLLVYGIAAVVVVRFGFVSLLTGIFTADLLLNLPVSFDAGAWYFTAPALAFLSIAGLAIWAFRAALGGRKLVSEELF
jgi:hypothetical protein